MALFSYKAAQANGEVIEGEFEATDRDSVARRLQAAGNTPLRIEEAALASRSTGGPGTRKPARAGDIDLFTLELTTLLRAKLSLGQALETLATLADTPAARQIARKVRDTVREGGALSAALARSGAGFDSFYCSMVKAGESAGALDLTLDRLADHRAARRAFGQALLSAMIYPAILLVLALIAVGILLVFVVPRFAQLFAEAGRELPWLTRLVVATGDFVTHWWWLVLVIAGFIGTALYRTRQSPEGRRRWDGLLLGLPLIGSLIRKLETARFSRTLAILLRNGVHMVPAMEIANETVANRPIHDALAQASQRVREGEGLAQALSSESALQPLAARLIRIGEASGRLNEMLEQIAHIHEEDVQTSLKRLLTFVEPTIIIAMALLVSTIILSIVTMILDSNTLAF